MIRTSGEWSYARGVRRTLYPPGLITRCFRFNRPSFGRVKRRKKYYNYNSPFQDATRRAYSRNIRAVCRCRSESASRTRHNVDSSLRSLVNFPKLSPSSSTEVEKVLTKSTIFAFPLLMTNSLNLISN